MIVVPDHFLPTVGAYSTDAEAHNVIELLTYVSIFDELYYHTTLYSN